MEFLHNRYTTASVYANFHLIDFFTSYNVMKPDIFWQIIISANIGNKLRGLMRREREREKERRRIGEKFNLPPGTKPWYWYKKPRNWHCRALFFKFKFNFNMIMS